MTAPTADATSTDTNTDELDDLLDGTDATATDADETDNADGADALGDAGKKALDAMKAKWRAERARAKAAEDKLAAASKPTPSEDGTDLEAMREQARSEARTEVLKDRALDKIEAKAAGRFKDPEDALLRLGKNVDNYISDGKIDLEAIEDDLVELLEKRPDFGVTQGDSKRFKGTADGGPKTDAGKPQVTEAQLKTMTPEQIVAAQKEGRLEKLLGG